MKIQEGGMDFLGGRDVQRRGRGMGGSEERREVEMHRRKERGGENAEWSEGGLKNDQVMNYIILEEGWPLFPYNKSGNKLFPPFSSLLDLFPLIFLEKIVIRADLIHLRLETLIGFAFSLETFYLFSSS